MAFARTYVFLVHLHAAPCLSLCRQSLPSILLCCAVCTCRGDSRATESQAFLIDSSRMMKDVLYKLGSSQNAFGAGWRLLKAFSAHRVALRTNIIFSSS